MYRGNPQNWKALGAPALWDRLWLIPKTKLGSAGTPSPLDGAYLAHKRQAPSPHMCYHVKFGSSASKGVCRKRKPKIGERWGAFPCDGSSF